MNPSSPVVTAVGALSRLRILTIILTLSLLAHGIWMPAQGSPYATPIVEAPGSPSGSISIEGWDGDTEILFEVSDSSGDVLDSGLLDSSYYQSGHLIAQPGSAATLRILANSTFEESSVTSVADPNGELHFVVTLVPNRGIVTSSNLSVESAGLESLSDESPIEYTIVLVSSENQAVLPNHMVTVTDGNGLTTSSRSDSSGAAVFQLVPGSYRVLVDPYGAHAGADLVLDVSEASKHSTVTLTKLNSGWLLVSPLQKFNAPSLVRVVNEDGMIIGESPFVGADTRINNIAFGNNYTVRIEGTDEYKLAISEPFNFTSSDTRVQIKILKQYWGGIYFFLTTTDGSALPEEVEISVTNGEWTNIAIARKEVGGVRFLGGLSKAPTGNANYELSPAGFKPVTGVAVIPSTDTVHVHIALEPAPILAPTPTPSPTVAPSPTPTVVPSPTPTVVPSPTPTIVPSPTPTIVPSPTPTVVPSPTPTAVPSPTPTVVPSPTPTVVPSPTPTVVPSSTPTAVPSPTPAVVSSPTPTVVPSPTPTAVPSPTPTVVPSPTPMAVPSPTPTVVPSPTPTIVPSPTPTVVPSPTPTMAVPSPTPTEVPISTDLVTPTITAEPDPLAGVVVSPTATSVVVETVTPAPAPFDDEVTTTIRLVTPDGQPLTGAPFELYAPVVSQYAFPPYLRGTVGPDNRIDLVNLPPGTYRLVVRPAGAIPLELKLELGSVDSEIVLSVKPQRIGGSPVEPVVKEHHDNVLQTPRNDVLVGDTGTNRIVVTGLPETGGTLPANRNVWLVPLISGVLAVMIAMSLVLRHRRE